MRQVINAFANNKPSRPALQNKIHLLLQICIGVGGEYFKHLLYY